MTPFGPLTNSERMPPTLYVLGGRQRAPRSLAAGSRIGTSTTRPSYGTWIPRQGRRRAFDYVLPPEASPPVNPPVLQEWDARRRPPVSVHADRDHGDRLPSFEREMHRWLPFFNDLYDVRNASTWHAAGRRDRPGTWWSSSSRMAALSMSGPPWTTTHPTRDFRGPSTSGVWQPPSRTSRIPTTCSRSRLCLGHSLPTEGRGPRFFPSGSRIEIGVERPHALLCSCNEGHVYFTTVNGRIIVVECRDIEGRRHDRAAAMHPKGMLSAAGPAVSRSNAGLLVGRILRVARRRSVSKSFGRIAQGFVAGLRHACRPRRRRCAAKRVSRLNTLSRITRSARSS